MGFEPTVSHSVGERLIHWATRAFYSRWGSNPQSPVPKTDALSIALLEHFTHGGDRTHNLRFRRPAPYPLGHAGVLLYYFHFKLQFSFSCATSFSPC